MPAIAAPFETLREDPVLYQCDFMSTASCHTEKLRVFMNVMNATVYDAAWHDSNGMQNLTIV